MVSIKERIKFVNEGALIECLTETEILKVPGRFSSSSLLSAK